ncbi:hypothetical protein EJ04DRAFT_88828 [Polyplosphaeria fusca]|uniref:Uncharacterized protein n=1 Tax=Polyplosphaeria fusca TaxID=682080 RepID=A0A9P4QPX0_9PLEO|nr:hypothetical protein EJ04DRAFT_88828 [Polyplosphaeria fusca]
MKRSYGLDPQFSNSTLCIRPAHFAAQPGLCRGTPNLVTAQTDVTKDRQALQSSSHRIAYLPGLVFWDPTHTSLALERLCIWGPFLEDLHDRLPLWVGMQRVAWKSSSEAELGHHQLPFIQENQASRRNSSVPSHRLKYYGIARSTCESLPMVMHVIITDSTTAALADRL